MKVVLGTVELTKAEVVEAVEEYLRARGLQPLGATQLGVTIRSDLSARAAYYGDQPPPAPAQSPVARWWRTVLGLAPGGPVTRADVEKAYRQLALERHPDRVGGSHKAMTQLNAAREAALKEVSP